MLFKSNLIGSETNSKHAIAFFNLKWRSTTLNDFLSTKWSRSSESLSNLSVLSRLLSEINCFLCNVCNVANCGAINKTSVGFLFFVRIELSFSRIKYSQREALTNSIDWRKFKFFYCCFRIFFYQKIFTNSKTIETNKTFSYDLIFLLITIAMEIFRKSKDLCTKWFYGSLNDTVSRKLFFTNHISNLKQYKLN